MNVGDCRPLYTMEYGLQQNLLPFLFNLFLNSKFFKISNNNRNWKTWRKFIEMFGKNSAPITILKLDLDFGYWYQNQVSVAHYLDDLKSIWYYSEPRGPLFHKKGTGKDLFFWCTVFLSCSSGIFSSCLRLKKNM